LTFDSYFIESSGVQHFFELDVGPKNIYTLQVARNGSCVRITSHTDSCSQPSCFSHWHKKLTKIIPCHVL
jgi:hypothetical protein